MNYEKVNAKACLIASVFLGIVYVLIFYFFPSAKESMKYKNIDFSELVHALKILYLCLFGLGVSFYKFSFKLLRTKIENIYPKLIKFLLMVFKILLYITSFLLSKTYIFQELFLLDKIMALNNLLQSKALHINETCL